MPKKADPFRKAVGKRLRALRVAKGFDTLRAFAHDLGPEEDRYDAWEKGKSLIPAQFVEVLRDRYGVTADWIYFGDASGLTVAMHKELSQAA